MNKRKSSAEGNGQKPASRRASTASMLAKKERSPSKTTLVNRVVEVSVPKTRFSSGDRFRESRSSSSPRLKSFPAERLKKLDSPPPFSPKPMAALIVQQNPCEAGSLFVVPVCGQGDAVAAVEAVHQHRQSAGSASQQQVASHQAAHQVSQTSPNSESVLVRQTISPNSQAHRPFVPSAPHVVPAYNHSPRKTGVPVSQNMSATLGTPLTTNPRASEYPQNNVATKHEGSQRPETNGFNMDYEKQSVGGRNADLRRKVTMQQKQHGEPRSEVHVNDSGWNEPPNDGPVHAYPQSNVYTPNNRNQSYLNHRNPQQVYQQLQQNMAHQQQMQQRAMDHRLEMQGNREIYRNYYAPQQLTGPYFPGHGMTSPQDMTINQIRNYRNSAAPVQPYFPMHQRDIRYIGDSQNHWVQNDRVISGQPIAKAQLKPFAVDLVDRDQTPCPMPDQQLVDQPAVPSYHCQHPAITQRQFYGDSPQNYSSVHQSTNANRQITQPSRQPQCESADLTKSSGKKRIVQFTAEMIRDQEWLVSTMRQQGIPDDVMRRQFDALLNEQRKHLLYAEQLQRREDSPERKMPQVSVRARKRIDEKPEWMIHITPPRVSYTDIERLNAEKRSQRSDQHEKLTEMTNVRQQREEINEACSKEEHSIQTPLNDQHTCNFWQQHQDPRQFGNGISGYANTNSYGQINNAASTRNTYDPTTMHQQQHCHYTQELPYLQPAQYQRERNSQFQYPEAHQNGQEYKHTSEDDARRDAYDEKKRRVDEPSSLLKMRVYKEIIRPQKRNNGLQDAETIRKALEALKSPEYLGNPTRGKLTVKLNGVQQPDEAHPDLLQRPTAESLQAQRRTSANGLENVRNPNNVPQRRVPCLRTSDRDVIREYPRQRQNNPRYCYSMQAERENGTVAISQRRSSEDQRSVLPAPEYRANERSNAVPYNGSNPMAARHNVMPFKLDGPYPQCYQQMQRQTQRCCNSTRSFDAKNGEGDVDSTRRDEILNGTCANRAGGDACGSSTMDENVKEQSRSKVEFQTCGLASQKFHGQNDMQEARTIGGITYLARKPDYIPNSQIMPAETSIASRHLQPPVFY